MADAFALGYSVILSKLLRNENPSPMLRGGGGPIAPASGIPNPFAPLQEWCSLDRRVSFYLYRLCAASVQCSNLRSRVSIQSIPGDPPVDFP